MRPGAHASRLPWILVGAAPVLLVLVAMPPIEWLPPAGDASLLLGVLLSAQAAIAALTLAVTLFVLQAGARRDAGDRVYEEYISQSWVTAIFRGSVGAVGVTGLVLVAEDFGARGVPWLDARPGLSNLALARRGCVRLEPHPERAAVPAGPRRSTASPPGCTGSGYLSGMTRPVELEPGHSSPS